MRFSIITPSFKQLSWLRLCIASVKDQVAEGEVEVEHIVQDAGTLGIEGFAAEMKARFSREGALSGCEQCTSAYTLSIFVEKDEGMYDAINRGLRRASGDMLAYLNCDEQYFPSALAKVAQAARNAPDVSIFFGDAILCDELRPLSYRRMVLPTLRHLEQFPLNTLTCSTFFRRKIVDAGIFFPPHWRIIGDKAWIYQLLQKKLIMSLIRAPLAAFFFTGNNLSGLDAAKAEKAQWQREHPSKKIGILLRFSHFFRKFFAGAYHLRRIRPTLFTSHSPNHRVLMEEAIIGPFWPRNKR